MRGNYNKSSTVNSCHWPAPLMGRFALSQPYSTNNEKGTTVVTISFHIHLRLFLNRKRLILWGLCLTISLRQQKDVLELKTCQTHKKNILVQFVKKNFQIWMAGNKFKVQNVFPQMSKLTDYFMYFSHGITVSYKIMFLHGLCLVQWPYETSSTTQNTCRT